MRISFQNIVENVRNSAFQVSSFWKNDAIFLIRTDLCAEFSALFGDIDIFMKLKVYNGLKPGKGGMGDAFYIHIPSMFFSLIIHT